MKKPTIRDKVAIAGIGSLNYAEMYRTRDGHRSPEDLGATALRDALTDAGLHKSDIEGLCVMGMGSYHLSAMLGLAPGQLRYFSEHAGSGPLAGVAFQTAVMVIASGMAETVACVYGNATRSAGTAYAEASSGLGSSYSTVYGTASPGAATALAFSRYAKDFGVPEDALAPLAISNRKYARNNPHAVMRDALSYDDYMNARYIAEPLRLYDYSLVNDGAVAVILTTPERAVDLRQPPVQVEAMAASATIGGAFQMADDCWASAAEAAHRLWSDSGLFPGDMDVAACYDDFTPTALSSLEAFGYCERGTGWEFIRDGRIEAGGEIPLNTSGGHTSESYMQGWNHIAELIRQVRCQSANQVHGCEYAHYMCYSPIITSLVFARS